MTREEVKKIIMIMSASYPNYKPQDLTMTVDTWHMMLEDYAYNQVALALKAFVISDTKGFAPSVGQLIDKLQKISQPEELNEMQAWTLVSAALRNGYYGAEEEFYKLPPLVQKAIGAPAQLRNWSQTGMESIENVVQSNFLRTYRAVLQRELDVSRMPAEIKDLIEANQPKASETAAPKIENKNIDDYIPAEEPPELKTLIGRLTGNGGNNG